LEKADGQNVKDIVDCVQHLREQDTTPGQTHGQDSLSHRIRPSDRRQKGKSLFPYFHELQKKKCNFVYDQTLWAFPLFLLDAVLTPDSIRHFSLPLCYVTIRTSVSGRRRMFLDTQRK
ncbi:hypothetical protein KCV07_g297, partial [Aureobasidium melanogenum]